MAYIDDRPERKDNRMSFMSDEEMHMIDDYLTKIDQVRGEMGDVYARMEKEQKAYSGDQEIVQNRPNSRVNIVNANIEGQVASIIDQNIAIMARGEGPSDQSFADWARIGLDWTLRKNHIKRIIERHERRRLLFGWAWAKVHWDPDAVKGFGLAKFECPPSNSVFMDTKINDPLRLQEAEYIAEVMLKSRTWALEKFGDMAYNINYGGSDRASIFGKNKTQDDDNAFWYIQLWTKTDGKLRLIEMSEDGILLSDSFKEWDGKKFKDIADPEPYYRYNKYPYFLTNLYYEEGELLGFGDGKLLRPLQDMINDLYDQIRRAARPNRIFFDEQSEVDLEDIDEDDGPVPCNDPNTTIRVVEMGRVNPALWQLLNNIHTEVQRVTRFSELMTGQGTGAKTATESAIQQQQGSGTTDSKKQMLQETLVEMCEYALDLMMENYTEGKAFRIDEDKEDYEWIDFRQLNEVPMLKPASDGFVKEFRESNPDAGMPQWEQMADDSGKPMTKSVDLDIEISIGAGLPKNKAFLYQMLEKLSQVIIQGQNVISWEEFRTFAKDMLGLPLDDNTEMMLQQQQQAMQGLVPGGDVTQGAMTEGLTAGGNPMMSSLPPSGGVL